MKYIVRVLQAYISSNLVAYGPFSKDRTYLTRNIICIFKILLRSVCSQNKISLLAYM